MRLGIQDLFCSNVCAMYDKHADEEVGGFVLEAIFYADIMMAQALLVKGYGVYYCADAIVEHWHNYSAFEQLIRNFDVAVSQQCAGGYFTTVKSEKEGIKLVKSSMAHMWNTKHKRLVLKDFWQSGFKFIGYKLGQQYKKLPKWLIKKLSLNPSFWSKTTITS